MRIRRLPVAVAGLVATAALTIVGGTVYADYTHVANTSAWVGPSGSASGSVSPSPSPSPTTPPPPPPPTLKLTNPVKVSMVKGGVYAWALMDRKTGEITGSANSTTYHNTTESMIKAWLVADFLRRKAAAGQKPTATELKYASTAIRDSNDNSAQWLYVRDGGAVEAKYPGRLGLAYGADVCKSVTQQLVYQPTTAEG